jgi:hypothetical protein
MDVIIIAPICKVLLRMGLNSENYMHSLKTDKVIT